MAAGPRAEHSMILMPCSGGVVAIGPPVVEGRIVAAAATGAGPRTSPYWGDGDGGPRRRLTVFAGTAPRYGSLGLANHGPMAAEALAHLGRDDAIAGWVERYRLRLDEAPPPADRPLTEADWPAALGQAGPLPRVAGALRERGRRPAGLLPSWANGRRACCPARSGRPRTGSSAPGTRCAACRRGRHATAAPRGGDRARPSGPRATRSCPGPPLLIGHEGVPEALADLPYLPEEAPRAVLISDRVACVADIADEFEQAVASLGLDGRGRRAARPAGGGRVAGLPAQRGRRRGDRPPARHHVAAGLRAAAALAGRGGPRRRPRLRLAGRGGVARRLRRSTGSTPVPAERRPSTDALVDRAVASGDEHAIKLTEAALRSFAAAGTRCSCWRRPTPATASEAEARPAGTRRQARG